MHALANDTVIPAELFEATVEEIELISSDNARLRTRDQGASAQLSACNREHYRIDATQFKAKLYVGSRPAGRFHRFMGLRECRLVDISIGGVCLETEAMLIRGGKVVLYLSSGSDDELSDVELSGRVVHSYHASKRQARYGIRFDEVPPISVRTAISSISLRRKLLTMAGR